MFNNVGDNLNKVRKEKKITLATLAKATDLSTGYLSNVERGLTSPTLENLQHICNALEISFTDLILDLQEDKTIVKKENRKVVIEDKTDTQYELMTEGNKNLKCVSMKINTDEEFISYKHKYDEFGIMIKGKLEVKIENRVYEASAGDTVYIHANSDHSIRKIGNEECIVYWIYQTDISERIQKLL